MYPLGLLILYCLHPDLLNLELNAAKLDDIVLPQLIVEFLLTLFETTNDKVHSLSSVGWECLILWRVLLWLILYLVLRQEIVVFRHFRRF